MRSLSHRFHPALLALAVWAAPAAAQNVRRPIVSGDTVINRPGQYVLTNDIRVTGGGFGIRVEASGVEIDLQGHEVRGPGGKNGTGILVMNAQGVKVSGGRLSNLAFGVIVDTSSNVVINHLQIRGEGLTITSLPPETGVMIVQSRNVVVEHSVIYNVGLGIFVRGGNSFGNRISSNTITAGTNGALGICYNPAPDDSRGPRGDLISHNLVTGFEGGVATTDLTMYNVFRDNTIAHAPGGFGFQHGNDTNQEVDNVVVPLPPS